jgi:phage portal protein BeeE
MKLSRLFTSKKRSKTTFMEYGGCHKSADSRPEYDTNSGMEYSNFQDSYLYNAWVHIAVSILIRNIARANFTMQRGGNEVTTRAVYELFHRPNSVLSRYDLWKETTAWWNLEGEAFWWSVCRM